MTDKTNLSGGKRVMKTMISTFLIVFVFILTNPAMAQEAPPQPLLSGGLQTTSSLPEIIGETDRNTIIDVYIDGQLVGEAGIIEGPLVTDYFKFKVQKNLMSGDHTIKVIAKDKDNIEWATESKEKILHVIPFPKPTLFAINEYTNGQPVIKGVAKNDSTIRIYADDQLAATFPVANHISGTASFHWTATGGNKFYATATDPEGKLSFQSNVLTSNATTPIPVTPTQPTTKPTEPVIEKPVIEEPITEPEEPAEEIKVKVTETIKEEPKEVAIKDTIEEGTVVVEEPIEEIETKIDESSKAAAWIWGLLIFIVVVIFFWLRRNLNKEKSGEVMSQDILKPEEPKQDNLPAIQQEPLIKIPSEQPPVEDTREAREAGFQAPEERNDQNQTPLDRL